jgi:hypothetical protein
MSETVKLFFAFLSLVAVGIIVTAFVMNPEGTKALGSATLGQLNNTLAILGGKPLYGQMQPS